MHLEQSNGTATVAKESIQRVTAPVKNTREEFLLFCE